MKNEALNANAQAVLKIVQAANNHPTALEVYEGVKQIRPHIGFASVYRILHNLAAQNLISELGKHEDKCRYDGNTERHDHAVCTTCGKLVDIPITISLSAEVLQAAAQATGIKLLSHEIRLYGECPMCSELAQNHPT